MARRKTRNPQLLHGDIAQWRRPNWRPVLELVGELSTWFMWMGEIELEDGTSVHAYKHRSTRRYLHLGVDGRAFDYVPPRAFDADDPGRYRPTSRVEAIEEAFYRWEDLHGPGDDREEVAAQLELAKHVAGTDGRMTVDLELLARQRRFDLACEAAARDDAEMDPGFADLRLSSEGDGFVADLPESAELIELAEARAARKAA